MDLIDKSDARTRLNKVFRFLKELNQLRNPVPRDLSGYSEVMRLDSWPIHPLIVIRRGDRHEEDYEPSGAAELEPLVRIRRANLTPCPKPPETLDGWLKPGWQAARAEVEVLASRNFPNKETGSITVQFEEGEKRVAALEAWTAARARWATAERPAIAARELFERVHALWTTMQREGDRVELVLADGMLNVPEHSIRHPVLLQRVNLEFDPSGPEFRFSGGTEKVELHRALLRMVLNIEGAMIAHFDKELEAQPIEPLGGESADGFLRRLVQGLFTDGEFLDGMDKGVLASRPSIRRDAVIFLRPRIAGLTTVLDYIIEDLEDEKTEPPEGLTRIVGVETSEEIPALGKAVPETIQRTAPGLEPDVLFSKPANAEQYEIARRLTKAKAVLVQGPPGTGKTHTIANLLGHLLAQGKTVLVTAHTTKALRVLRGQVDKALQPLCLSVLEGDADSQAQLARAAQEIANRLSGTDAASLRREGALLRDKRQKLRDATETLRRQLRDARFSEVEEMVLGGEALSPIEVAKRIKGEAERDGWIPGPLHAGILCPLSEAEIQQLYATQVILAQTDEAQLAVAQPTLSELVSSADFRLLATERADADSRARAHRPELWSEDAGQGFAASQIQQLHHRVQTAVAVLGEEQRWLREVLFAGWVGGDHRGAWDDLLEVVETLATEAATAERLRVAFGPELPKDRPLEEVATTLAEVVTHLATGGSLGFKTKLTKRPWHQLLDACCVEGRPPKTHDEIQALLAVASLEVNRKRFMGRWCRTVERLDGPAAENLGDLPERPAQGYAAEIRTRLEWRETVWEPLIAELGAVGFRWEIWLAEHPPVPGDHGELARVQRAGSSGLAEVVEAQAALIRQAELSDALQVQRTYLAGFPQSEVASVLLQAQDEWNVKLYEDACLDLARLEGLRSAHETRMALLARLETVAPTWARAIAQRWKPHHLSQTQGNATSAWRWRQWHQELERRASVSLSELQVRIEQAEGELRRLAAEIIEHDTWAAQRERTGLRAQQALMGYVQTIRKVGKGTGKRAPELLRKARQLLASARHAVPVWVMPLSRVYESFDPRETKFDVVIVDEASQSDVTALAALYLGREHVVVGDKEQVTPDAIGQRIDEVQRLISTDLQGIPNSHLYDGQTSIYDLAETAFGGVIALREHFRCVPEIIQFSNSLSYDLTIRPLREPMSAALRPALVAHKGVRLSRRTTQDQRG